jgi:hypothetical protein
MLTIETISSLIMLIDLTISVYSCDSMDRLNTATSSKSEAVVWSNIDS